MDPHMSCQMVTRKGKYGDRLSTGSGNVLEENNLLNQCDLRNRVIQNFAVQDR